jgi:hypothetical protein
LLLQAESAHNGWKQILLDCRCRPASTAHLELYLDWSLSRLAPGQQQEASPLRFVASNPLAQATRALQRRPARELQAGRAAGNQLISISSIALEQAAGVTAAPGPEPEACPDLVLQLLGLPRQRPPKPKPAPAQQLPGSPAAQTRKTPAWRSSGAGASAAQRTPAVPAAPAVRQPGPASATAAAGEVGDMAFFLQLQGGGLEGAEGQQPQADSQDAGVSIDHPDGATALPQEVQVSRTGGCGYQHTHFGKCWRIAQ